jgi:flavin reductase (DIM6/NTAB) family NADH-FMN oxidoreductase RutF
MAGARVSDARQASPGLTSRPLAECDAEGERYLRDFVQVASREVTVAAAQAPDGRLAAARCEGLRVLSAPELLVAWELRCAADDAAVFERATHFALNVMGSEGADWARALGDAGHEKFARIGFEFGRGGAPLLESAVAALECVNRLPRERGAHAMFVGRALKVRSTAAPALFQGEITDD